MISSTKLSKFNIILASKSPRRQTLLAELGIKYKVFVKDEIKEIYPNNLVKEQIAVFLAEEKARAYENDINDNDLIITADTIVWIDNQVLGKPTDSEDARKMLSQLSGNTHTVITGICLKTKNKQKSFYAETEVKFKTLTTDEIDYYIEKYKPFDKAGAYGIQEWIGYIGVESINGSYFNVMGLPIQRLYEELTIFIEG